MRHTCGMMLAVLLAMTGRAGAEQVTGVVMAAGKPVRGAEVVAGKGRAFSLSNSTFFSGRPVVTDGEGRFTLERPAGADGVLVLCDEGWGTRGLGQARWRWSCGRGRGWRGR